MATEIAAKYNLNIRTLNTSLIKLVRAGILKSQIGGVDRGYIYARDPKTVTIFDIVSALDDHLKPWCCCSIIKSESCREGADDNCIIFNESLLVAQELNNRYRNISIYDYFKSCDFVNIPDKEDTPSV